MPQAVDDTTEILTGSKVPIFAPSFRAWYSPPSFPSFGEGKPSRRSQKCFAFLPPPSLPLSPSPLSLSLSRALPLSLSLPPSLPSCCSPSNFSRPHARKQSAARSWGNLGTFPRSTSLTDQIQRCASSCLPYLDMYWAVNSSSIGPTAWGISQEAFNNVLQTRGCATLYRSEDERTKVT